MPAPWRKDTNDRYTAVVKLVAGFSTAGLFLPVLLAREFLGVASDTSLREIFDCSVYLSLSFLTLSIASGVFYQYLSAKWVRLAWGQNAGIFWSKATREETIECLMEIFFWATIGLFGLGLATQLFFFVSYSGS